MTPRPLGERETPERDVRESLAGPDQAQLDALQDIAIKGLEFRSKLALMLSMIALSLALTAVVAVLSHQHPQPSPQNPPCPSCRCPDLSCPATVCPAPICPPPVCPSLPVRSRRHR